MLQKPLGVKLQFHFYFISDKIKLQWFGGRQQKTLFFSCTYIELYRLRGGTPHFYDLVGACEARLKKTTRFSTGIFFWERVQWGAYAERLERMQGGLHNKVAVSPCYHYNSMLRTKYMELSQELLVNYLRLYHPYSLLV